MFCTIVLHHALPVNILSNACGHVNVTMIADDGHCDDALAREVFDEDVEVGLGASLFAFGQKLAGNN